MLDPVQNHALRLCLGAYRTSASSLCVELLPVYVWKQMSPLAILGGKNFYSSIALITIINIRFSKISVVLVDRFLSLH